MTTAMKAFLIGSLTVIAFLQMETALIGIVIWLAFPIISTIKSTRQPPGSRPFITPSLKGFWGGSLGVIVTGLLIAIIGASYTDYSTRAEASEALAALEPLKSAIANDLLNGHDETPIQEALKQVTAHPFIRQIKILEGKIIFVKSGEAGQSLFLLTPALHDGKVTWDCVGGANKYVPSNCRYP